MGWIRSFGYKYRQDSIPGAPHCYIQRRVTFRRGRVPERSDVHTGCREHAVCVMGYAPDWARRHEAEAHTESLAAFVGEA
jgi:hypothetical protein